MGSVRQLCKTGIVLENGKIVKTGKTEDAVSYYLQQVRLHRTPNHVIITDGYRDKGHRGDILFKSFHLLKEDACYSSTESIVLHIALHANKAHKDCRINCTIWDSEETPVGSVVSFDGFDIDENEDKFIEFTIKNPGLANGFYTFSFSVGIGDITKGLTLFDAARNFITFEINRVDDNKYFTLWRKSWGDIYLQSFTKEIPKNESKAFY
jgi:lipopolysaccharide transport system ATP-binding protein